jgi:DNA-binding response OmpR family regulator
MTISQTALPAGATPRAFVGGADRATRTMCRAALEASGFDVHDMDKGVAVVSAARLATPDIVFLDDQLRDVPGREVVGWLRSNPALRATPIVLLSERSDGADSLPSAEAPTRELRKPVTFRTIRHTVRSVFGRALPRPEHSNPRH